MVRLFFIICMSAFMVNSGLAKKYLASNADQFVDYVKILMAGDTLEMLNGTYDLESYVSIKTSGTAEQPIVIKAQSIGGVVLNGESFFTLKGVSHIIVQGFDFRSQDGTAIKLEGCNHIRITRNFFRLSETTSHKWIVVGGKWDDPNLLSEHNRIDHNLFENKSQPGNYITLDGTPEPTSIPSKCDRIDHNYFRNNKPRVENEKESVRLGQSELSWDNGYTTVEYNLFEECDGDPEIVSVKTSADTIRYNTFLRCQGTLCLRQTKNSMVYGNFFLGEHREGTGGIRVYGSGHRIFNNYFMNLTGEKWDAAITLTNGDAENTSTSYSKHFRPEGIEICFNTLIDNQHSVEFGFTNNGKFSKPPRNITFSNNLIVTRYGPVFKVFTEPQNLMMTSNWVDGKNIADIGIAYDSLKIKTGDPILSELNGIWKITESSPLKDEAQANFEFVFEDIDGQLRDALPDIGADEYSSASIKNFVLTADDVGPLAFEDWTEGIERSKRFKLKNYFLLKNYPNPFNSTTILEYTIPTAERVKLTLFDVNGRKVKELLHSVQPAGHYHIRLQTADLASGVYFCKLQTDHVILSRKLIKLK